MKQHILQSSVHGDDDLNVEHLQLLLLLFHNMSERGRRSVLALVTQAITEVAQNRDSQLKAVPLNLARLCLVFDYLLRHYSKTPLYLFEQVTFSFIQISCFLSCLLWAKGHYGYVLFPQVQYNLLTPPCSEPGSVQDAGKRSSLPLYCSFKEVEENWVKHCSAGKQDHSFEMTAFFEHLQLWHISIVGCYMWRCCSACMNVFSIFLHRFKSSAQVLLPFVSWSVRRRYQPAGQ